MADAEGITPSIAARFKNEEALDEALGRAFVKWLRDSRKNHGMVLTPLNGLANVQWLFKFTTKGVTIKIDGKLASQETIRTEVDISPDQFVGLV
jgi:hypothetical protein